MAQKTPLYDEHTKLNGKMVSFAGFSLPIQYTDITQEHMAVRNKAGIFDVSHMGELTISGKDALKTLNYVLPSDITTLAPGKVRYMPILNQNGGIVDDVLVYCFSTERYRLVVNAANIEKDESWILQNIIGDTQIKNISDTMGLIALQGPVSYEILKNLVSEEHIPKGFFSFVENAQLEEVVCLISRTGYTGSFGYEIYCNSEDTVYVWQKLMEVGTPAGLLPCGLGARDTLRMEACMPLYGQEISDDITPFEASLDFTIKMSKPTNFIGKDALEKKGAPKRIRVGLKVIGRGIVRGESKIILDEKEVGVTTSGTFMPYMNAAYAMGMVDIAHTKIGTVVDIDVRGRKVQGEVVPMPFYRL
ncbi:MAG: glycine cleavage system aminomethyltransferase GcvT [Defluviitaleaceae bacterium]|nr:glycine cleavage system aminomethyltransferase GcvT [Defluviitaleaceae bacterium]